MPGPIIRKRQKIITSKSTAYLTQNVIKCNLNGYFFQTQVRDKADITYKTSLDAIFLVKKYADALQKVVEKK